MTAAHIQDGPDSMPGAKALRRWALGLAVLAVTAVAAAEIAPIERAGFQVGTRRDYSGTGAGGAPATWVEEARELDETTFAPTPTVVAEQRSSAGEVEEHWYATADDELQMHGVQLPDRPFVQLSSGAAVAWWPMQVGDERVSKSTFTVHPYTYYATVTAVVLAEEQVVLDFDTLPAHKQSLKLYTVGPGLGELETSTQWIVPFLGVVKRVDESGTRELKTFRLVMGGRVVTPDTDADGDGLKDYRELVVLGTDWLAADTDGDVLLDGWELDNGFDPLVLNAPGDADGDGLTNSAEQFYGTNPRQADSDGDGVPDGDEFPVVRDDSYTVDEDTVLAQPAPGVLSNDDVWSEGRTLQVQADPAHGQLVLNADGSLQYTPDTDYHGPDAFTYTATEAGRRGASDSATVTITVSPTPDAPTITAAAVTPAVAYETSVLTAAASGWSDADNDPEGYRYQWERNGTPIADATGSTLTGADFDKGDTVACLVTPWDGTLAGTAIRTAGVTVRNSPPAFGHAAIVAEPPDGTVAPTVVVSGWADADGDLAGYRYQWQRNGVDIAGATAAALDPAGLAFRDVITCTVTAWDGDVEGMRVTCEPVGIVHPDGPDFDQDGVPDGWEIVHDLDPTDAVDADQDTDGDGITNRDEHAADTDPQRYVIMLQPGWNLVSLARVPVDHTVAGVFGNTTAADAWILSTGGRDGDYAQNTELESLAGHWIYSTQETPTEVELHQFPFPADPDSDGDGFSDAQEAARGTDPSVYALLLHYGWNLVSIARCPQDNRAEAIFGGAIRYPAWTWLTDHYVPSERIMPLHGYMVFCDRPGGALVVIEFP